jgi:prevent-host-death family protein
MDVSVRELKAHLSRYLRRVQDGEEMTVTLHGRRIARLSAVIDEGDKEDTEAAAVARLNALPWIRAGEGDTFIVPKDRICTPPGEPLISELVLKDRE